MNLQLRLCVVISVVFGAGMVFGAAKLVVDGRDEIRSEMASTANLTNHLFNVADIRADSPFNSDDYPQFLSELIAMEQIRHVDIRIQSDTADYPQVNNDTLSNLSAPGWFIAMVIPREEIVIKTFTQPNGDIIQVAADPSDEIEEIWLDFRNVIVARSIFLALLLAAVYFLVRYWMKPSAAILNVLDDVEAGDFSRRIPKLSLPELSLIGDRINHLTTVLGSSKTENERLTRKSVNIQEQERRTMAQELHDSLGQSVSAIKAIAVSIMERTRNTDDITSVSAKNIEEIADTAYKSVRALMGSLRPAVLDELGLTEALKQMVDEWNVHHEDTFCRLRLDGDFDNLHEDQQIHIYRIVQECLTNISKYARAENVDIDMSGNEIITLNIYDNGVGFEPGEITQSMGLMGIRDRVNILQGQVDISSKPGKGVNIQIEFPRITRFRRRVSDRRTA